VELSTDNRRAPCLRTGSNSFVVDRDDNASCRRGGRGVGGSRGSEADRTYEFSELLVDVLGVTDVRASCRHRVTHQRT